MAWEVAINETHDGEFSRYVFFCNTSDEPFGPVVSLNNCEDKNEFYKAWDKVNLGLDARTLSRLPGGLEDSIERMKKYFGEDEETLMKELREKENETSEE